MRLRSGVKTESLENSHKISSDLQNGMSNVDRTLQFGKYKVNYVVLLVHINICLYALCFWIQQGVFPYLSSKLGSGSVTYGYLQTTFAVVQLCGGPIFGRFGDVYGGRAALTLAFASCALSYAVLGFANSITLLFISRLPSLFMHAMQGGQMVVTDMASTDDRTTALGRLSISYGIGMVLGPFIGGLLAKFYGEQSAALVACAGAIISAVICYTQIPTATKRVDNQDSNQHKTDKNESNTFSLMNPKKYLTIIKHEKAFTLLLVRFVTGIPIGIFQSMFPLVAKDMYGLDAEHNGYIMSYVGVLSMIVQGLGLGVLRKKFSEMQLIKGGTFILIFAYIALISVVNIWQLVFAMIPLVLGLSMLTIVISAALTNSVEDQDTGAILGINMAVNSMIRAVSPVIGGYLLSSYGFSSFGYIGFVDSLLMTVYLVIKFKGE